MMTLRKAAETFNKLWFSGVIVQSRFQAQLLPFTDNVRSAPTTKRRILEVDPDIEVPAVIVNEITGDDYLVGNPSHDFFRETIVRSKYPLVPTVGEFTKGTVEEVLSNTGLTQVWANVGYIRREIIQDASDFYGGYYLILPGTEAMAAGDVIYLGGDYYRARELTYIDELGFSVVDSIRYTDLLQTLDVVVRGTYDPVDEVYSGGTTTSALCIVEPREKSFINADQSSEKTLNGDVTISSLEECIVGDSVGTYTVVDKQTSGLVFSYHGRPE